MDEAVAEMVDEQSGDVESGVVQSDAMHITSDCGYGGGWGPHRLGGYEDHGGASRFYWCSKANKADRHEGLDGGHNHHPTVKPTDLMRYLCRLVTPPRGVVLDPFMGSGSTGKAATLEGFDFVGIELDAGYLEIARRRIEHAQMQPALWELSRESPK